MKKSYKKMFVFELIILLLLLVNSFINNILSNYIMIIFLFIILYVFNKIFVIEKQKKRYEKDVMLSITIFLLVFFILYYLLGIIIGFSKTGFYNFDGIFKYILPTILFILGKEFLRFQIILKINKEKKLTILTILLFILMDITGVLYYKDFTSASKIFYFIALYVLPAITTNIFLTFLTEKVGYKPAVYYLLITKLYAYLLPIIPNPAEYLYCVINVCLPLVLYYTINRKLKKEEDEPVVSRKEKKNFLLTLFFPALLTLVLVYLTSGSFKYSLVSIASGSMDPKIKKGDAVIIKKINNKELLELKKGDIIAYKYANVLIIHRIEKVETTQNKYYFYTKGDANKDMDEWIVEDNMIVGKIILTIPYVGTPTIWMRSL